jgi:PKD repeat protein
VQHTYTSAGTYVATLIVTDSRGAASQNTAQQVITVTSQSPTPSPTPTATPSSTPTATPAATPTASPSATPTPTSTPTATPSATPTATPTATPSATPSATPVNVQLLNISGRVFAQSGDNVGIGGFIISGSGTKRIMARAIGPSLQVNGNPIPGRLQDPYLEVHDSNGSPPLTNDNWRSTQEAEIQQTGLAPTDDHESAIVKRLPAGNYTAIIRGADGSPGIGLIELYDLSSSDPGELGNLSVRAEVRTDDDVLFDGLILRGGTPKRVVFRALGPSLMVNGAPVPGSLQDPTLEVHDGNGTLLRSNDNWKDAPNMAEIEASGLAPTDDHESAILLTLPAGNYTSIVRGVDRTTGIGLAEAYKLNN